MTKARLQGPDNFGGLTHDGESYEADEDGIVEVPAHIPTEVLKAHQLVPAVEKAVKPLAKVTNSGKAGDGK